MADNSSLTLLSHAAPGEDAADDAVPCAFRPLRGPHLLGLCRRASCRGPTCVGLSPAGEFLTAAQPRPHPRQPAARSVLGRTDTQTLVPCHSSHLSQTLSPARIPASLRHPSKAAAGMRCTLGHQTATEQRCDTLQMILWTASQYWAILLSNLSTSIARNSSNFARHW